MASDRFKKAEELFHQALGLAPEDRDAFLARACGSDTETATLVRELLRAHELESRQSPLVPSRTDPCARELPPGTRIGKYIVEALLGSGGMGHVYAAKDIELHRAAAIKIAGKGLLGEARHAARLAHPNICAVYELVEHEGCACLVMERVHGVTLKERLRGGHLPFAATLRYASEIADALAHAHHAGVIHGDLKPANIMIDMAGSDGRIKVLDFGVARSIPGHDTGDTTTRPHENAQVGTLPYMPPEALRNERTDERADIWAFGVVLYQMVTGVPPFVGKTPFDLSSAILRDAPLPLDPGVPTQIRRVVRKCLEKDPARRYQTARELRADLEPRPVAIWRWVAAAAVASALLGGGAFLVGRSDTPRDRVAIAVLPLESLSGSGDEYFADGVTEVLIGDLAQVKAIRVISRQSAARYRGTATPLREIARALGVEYLVKGTVTRSGSQVRVTAQLLNPFTDEHLWSDAVTRRVEDLLTVQNEVARAIARRVAVTIQPEEERRFAQSRAVRPDVLEAYLRGRALWRSRSARNLNEALEAFARAVQLDPTHAQSHAGLADTYAVLASLDLMPAHEGYPAARAAAERALRLDPALADPHGALARVKFSYDWDGVAAEREFQTALSINPAYDTAHQWYAVFLATRRRLDEALREARLAEEGNPLSPITHWNVARTHFFRREPEEALAALGRALAIDPAFDLAHVLAARVHVAARRPDDAARALLRVPPEARRWEARALDGYLAALRGDGAAARAAAQRLETSPPAEYGPQYHLAKVYAALGDRERAFACLHRAADAREAQLVFLDVDPELDPLRSDARFHALAARVGVRDGR